MRRENLKVLCVVGSHRSGSTILDRVLGSMTGFFSAGELRFLLRGERHCGCGKPLAECELWGAVRRIALRGAPARHGASEDVMRWQRELGFRSIHRLLRRAPESTSDWETLSQYTDLLSNLYRAVGEVTGARVIVDSSKVPSHAATLALVPGITPYYLHLVRDPRGVAYSWQRSKRFPLSKHGAETNRYGTGYSVARWVGLNLAAEAVCRRRGTGRSILVRYEDFVARPRDTLTAVAELVRERSDSLPVAEERTVHLGPNHTVEGNPDRFTTGTVELREDTRWRREQARKDKVIATALALPLLLRYRYPVGAAPAPSPASARA